MNGKSNSVDQRKDIIVALRKHPEGLTLRDIAEIVGHHRHTITKYVYELIGSRVIYQREIGAAKLCYLRESYNGDLRKERAGIPGKIGKGQAQLIALFLILALVPATVIIAQNATNSTSAEGMVTGLNLTKPTAINDNQNQTHPDVPDEIPQDNATGPEDNLTIDERIAEPEVNVTPPTLPQENATQPRENETLLEENITLPEDNITLPEDNITLPQENLTLPEENATLPEENVTGPGNVTEPEENATSGEENVTTPEENATFPEENVTLPEMNATEEVADPEISVVIEMPAKVTRDKEDATIRAVITNAGGPAHNLVVEWIIPQGFSVMKGNLEEHADVLEASGTFISEITVFPLIQTALGSAEIMARVSYE